MDMCYLVVSELNQNMNVLHQHKNVLCTSSNTAHKCANALKGTWYEKFLI